MCSSHASQNPLTAILAIVCWMSTVISFKAENTGVKTRSRGQKTNTCYYTV